MKDLEGHVDAVASDLEYFRRKRIEPRVLLYLRRGIVSWPDLFRGHELAGRQPGPQPQPDLELRIRALEDSLDELILSIATASIPSATHAVAIDDNRTERGDYNPEFRLAARTYEGDVETRIELLEMAVAENRHLVAAFTGALVHAGEVTEEALD